MKINGRAAIPAHAWCLAARYDKVGNINRITDTVNSAQVVTFTYDALDRLTSAATTAVGNGQYSEGYTYNAIGNILSKGSATYQYTDTLHKHAVTTAGSNSYSYDANGNMLTRNEASVLYHQGWDAENRLQVVTNTVTGEVTRFVYDGDGARVQQIYSGTYTSTTIYLGAPTEINILGAPLPLPTSTIPPTMTYRAYLPLVAGGQPVPPRTQPFTNETWKMYYAVGNQVVAMRLLTTTGSMLYYLHSDHLGSTSLASDANGAAVPDSRQMYDPYGELRVEGTSLPTDIGYTGQRFDATGLMYYRARYYSAAVGRFVSADTLVSDPSDSQNLNRYSYGRNNPVRYIDPSGHCTKEQSDADYQECVTQRGQLQDTFGITIGGEWLLKEMLWIGKGLQAYGNYLWNLMGSPANMTSVAAFKFIVVHWGGLKEIRPGDTGSFATPNLPEYENPGLLQLVRAIKFTEIMRRPPELQESDFTGTLWHELTHYVEFAHPKLVDFYAGHSTVDWVLSSSGRPYNVYKTTAPVARDSAGELLADDVRDVISGTGQTHWKPEFVQSLRLALTLDHFIYSATPFLWR